jgi:hypothetical protein
MGDINARTGDNPDFITNDNCDVLGIDPDMYNVDLNMKSRFNQDKHVNIYGRKLLELCIATQLRILNGRTLGDLCGNYTSFQPNGKSTIDYSIVSEALLPSILYFVVDTPNHLSDHALISVSIKIDTTRKHIYPNSASNITYIKTVTWNDQINSKYISLLDKDDFINNLSNAVIENDIDKSCSNITDLMQDLYVKIKTFSNIKTKKKPVRAKWFDSSCRDLKHRVLHLGKLVQKYPSDPHIYGQFISVKKCYKKLIRKKEWEFKNNIMNTLDKLHSNDPREYWKLVKALRRDKIQDTPINLNIWTEHFKKLYSNRCDNNKELSRLLNENIHKYVRECNENHTFDKGITDEEILTAIKKQKNNKAHGNDYILNEMIKSAANKLTSVLVKLFNAILKTGVYPESWNISWITPIYKKGDTLDPNNYRAISVSSCLSKIFTHIINQRLGDFCDDNDIIPCEQIGFCKGHGTTDHIFVLKTIIDLMKRNKKNTILCLY